ncbi:MAG: rhodanese-like domain-containing protein [Gammaproteobacteria bacterium]|jgi:rhodanese-related sulfurtransferase
MSVPDKLRASFWWLPVGRVAEITATELHDRLSGRRRVQIIDVRSAAEWRRSHIPGAVSVPIQTLRHNLAALQLDVHLTIVAICLSAHRSIPAVRLLQAQGFANAVQLKGGMLAWWHKGYPTEGARS